MEALSASCTFNYKVRVHYYINKNEIIMRKIYLAFIGVVLATTASAQDFYSQAGYQLDSLYSVGATGERLSKTVNEYDAQGRATVDYGYTYVGGVETLSTKGVANYDDQGRSVKIEEFEYQNGGFVLTGYTENSEFDAEKRPTVMTEYGIDDENPAAGIQLLSKTVITKYNGLNPEDMELYAWNGAGWDLYATGHSDYNAQGLPVKTTTSMSIMGMTYATTITMEYDDHWQIVKSVTESGFGMNTVQEYVNSYDANGNLIKQNTSTMGVEVTMFLFWSKGGTTGLLKQLLDESSSAYYDLNGRRLNGKPQQKGIYVHQGKTVVIR